VQAQGNTQPTRTVRTPVPPIVIQPVASTSSARLPAAAAQPSYTARRPETAPRQAARTVATSQPQAVATARVAASQPRIQRSLSRAVSAIEVSGRSTAPGLPRVSSTAAPAVPVVARTQRRSESANPVVARTQQRSEPENPVMARTPNRTETENPVVARTGNRLPIVEAPGVTPNAPAVSASSGDMAPPPPLEAPAASGSGALVVASAPSISEYLQKAVDGPATPTALPVATPPIAEVASVSPPASAPTLPAKPTAKAVTVRLAMTRTIARIVPPPGITDVESIADGGVAPPVDRPSLTEAMEAASQPVTIAISDAPNGARTAFVNTRLLVASAENTGSTLGASPVAPIAKTSGKAQTVVETNPVLQSGSVQDGASFTVASSLLIGTSAKTSTLTPLFWGGDGTTSTAKFVLKLEEPLLASNQRTAFPIGTQLIVVAKPASANVSIADVEVVAIVIGGKEYAAPVGALVIRNDDNGLLVGEDYYRRDEQIANRDVLTFAGGAMSTLGQLLNRPTGTFSSTNTGNFGGTATNVVTNGSPNLLGAVLEGGFRDLPGIWSQRNQQALADLATQPRIYQIPKGRSVRVFVNQSINF
jgi:hypothetical protein